ncbi:MAG: transglycosylase SLT domain-containing protein [Thermoleophilaceae bacterium]
MALKEATTRPVAHSAASELGRRAAACLRCESGQSLVLLLGIAGAIVLGTLVLGAFGQALGARSSHQRAADLAAVSGARAMRDAYPRLFAAPYLRPGVPNPRHLSRTEYLVRARTAAVRGAHANGVKLAASDVSFPERRSFAPTRVTTAVRGSAEVRLGAGTGRGGSVSVRARATAELAPPASAGASLGGGGGGCPSVASGGGYSGPLACRMGKPMRPDVAQAFDRMAAAARADGITLGVNSAFRSDAEQRRLFAANPNPRWVAPPGTSLHRYATELDLGPPAAYGWLKHNYRRFGFIHRYAWEPWHYGYGKNPRDVPAQYEKGAWEPPDGDHDRVLHRLPSFVPERYRDAITRAALRHNVPVNLLAAQLYAESNFNPFARSPAGALGIAQFMPGTARAYGLRNPFDAEAAINAQARMMSELLRRFGSAALALAAYNAGPGAVARYGGIPPFAETRAYVARILGLLGGAGEISLPPFEVRLVE